jgi:tetratricopeptide (TPR) repeat protein
VNRWRLAALAAFGLIAAGHCRADDYKSDIAAALDGLRNRDYGAAVHSFMPLLRMDERAEAKGQGGCFRELDAGGSTAQSACDDFVHLSPNEPRAYIGRALSTILQGQPTQALSDLGHALELDPHNFQALILETMLSDTLNGSFADRGWGMGSGSSAATEEGALRDFKAGAFKDAAAGFRLLADEEGGQYGKMPLMLYIAQRRAGIKPEVDLQPLLKVGGARYVMLVGALTGRTTPKDALRTYLSGWGETTPDYAENRFFLGEAAIIQGDRAGAKRYLQRAAASTLDLTEVELAKVELARLP